MAKNIRVMDVTIGWNKASPGNPGDVYIRYETGDSEDPDVRSRPKSMVIASPSYNKTTHNAGTTGEFWADVLAAVKTAEGIS